MTIKLRSRHQVWAVIEPYGDVHLDRDGFDVSIAFQGKVITAYMPKEVSVSDMFNTMTVDDIRYLIESMEAA